MKQNKNIRRPLAGGLLGLFLLLGMAAPLTFTACESQQSEINITMKSDYSKLVQALNDANETLTAKLALIESALNSGFDDSQDAMSLVQKAVASLDGTVAEKLAAIEAAIKDQTTGFETKLALIEAAVKAGFADSKTQQALLKQAIESLGGTVAEKLAAVEAAVKDQKTSLETKLGLIEETVKAGLTDGQEAQDLIKDAIESLGGTMEDKLAAIEDAVKSQTTCLETKLALIEAAVKESQADSEAGLELIQKAIASLSGSATAKLSAIASAVSSSTSGLATKLAAIESALKQGLTDEKKALDLIKDAVASIPSTITNLGTDLGGKINDIITAIANIESALPGADITSALTDIFNAIKGLTSYDNILNAIREIIALIETEPSHGTPKDLTTWCYPNASFDIDLSKIVELGEIYYALDPSQDGSYTAEDIETVEFQPLADDIAPVKVNFEKDRHYISFIPDTTGSLVWRNFKDSTTVKREDVKGLLIVKDRWGAKDTLFNMTDQSGKQYFQMSWFNTHSLTIRKSIQINTIDDDDTVTVILHVLSQALGFDYANLQDCRYQINEAYTKIQSYKFVSALFRPESDSIEVSFLDDYAPGDNFGVLGTFSVSVQPSVTDLSFRPVQLQFQVKLILTITQD